MSPTLPPRPSLEWLRKTAKHRLAELRTSDPKATLAIAQRDVARDYGFESWRKLKAAIEEVPPAPHFSDETTKGFFLLVGKGMTDEVRDALDASPHLINTVGPHPFWGGRPQALHVAVETKHREMFDLLLGRGADVNGSNNQYDHWSPLMLAIHRGNVEMRDELLRRGARVGLVEALMLGDNDRVDELLTRGLPEVVPNDGSLIAFARTAHAIDRLLELGASPEKKDRWGSAPIDAMSRLGAEGIPLVRHLIARGASASPEEYARLGDLEALTAMVGADPAIARRDSVIIAAVGNRHHALVEWLLTHGASANARERAKSRQTALHEAAWNGDLRMTEILITAGADPASRDEEHNNTPLGWAETSREITNNPQCDEVAAYLRALM